MSGIPRYPRDVLHVGGVTAMAEDSFDRPADTTQYAVGDAISDSTTTPTLLTFPVARHEGMCGVVLRAVLISDAAPTTLLQAELWLFDREIVAEEDNAAADPSDAEMECYIGKYGFTLEEFREDHNSAAESEAGDVKAFVCQEGSVNIYGLLVAKNAYTPVSGETFTVRLEVWQD